MRRFLFTVVFGTAMLLGQAAFAASAPAPSGVAGADAILVGVLTVGIFLWIYSLIA